MGRDWHGIEEFWEQRRLTLDSISRLMISHVDNVCPRNSLCTQSYTWLRSSGTQTGWGQYPYGGCKAILIIIKKGWASPYATSSSKGRYANLWMHRLASTRYLLQHCNYRITLFPFKEFRHQLSEWGSVQCSMMCAEAFKSASSKQVSARTVLPLLWLLKSNHT